MELRSDIATAASRMTSEYDVTREIRQLGAYLREGETVQLLAAGIYGAGAGLLTVTNHRALFLRDGRSGQASEGFPLSRLTAADWTPDGPRASISVSDSNSTAVLRQVPFDDAVSVVHLIRGLAGAPTSRHAEGGHRSAEATTALHRSAPTSAEATTALHRSAPTSAEATTALHRSAPTSAEPGSGLVSTPISALAAESNGAPAVGREGSGSPAGTGSHRADGYPDGGYPTNGYPDGGGPAAGGPGYPGNGSNGHRNGRLDPLPASNGHAASNGLDALGDGFLPGGRTVNGASGPGGRSYLGRSSEPDHESAAATTMTFNRPDRSGPGWTGVRGIPEPAGPSESVHGSVPISALDVDPRVDLAGPPSAPLGVITGLDEPRPTNRFAEATGQRPRVPEQQRSPESPGPLGLTNTMAGEVSIAQLAAEEDPAAALPSSGLPSGLPPSGLPSSAPPERPTERALPSETSSAPAQRAGWADELGTPVHNLDAGSAATGAVVAGPPRIDAGPPRIDEGPNNIAGTAATTGLTPVAGITTQATTGVAAATGAAAAAQGTGLFSTVGGTTDTAEKPSGMATEEPADTASANPANLTAEGTERPKPISWRPPSGRKINPLGGPKDAKGKAAEEPSSPDTDADSESEEAPSAGFKPSARRTRWVWLGAGAAALVGLAAIGSVKLLSSNTQDVAVAPVSPVPAAAVDSPTGPVVQVSKVLAGDRVEVTGQYTGTVVILGIVSPSGTSCGAAQSKQYAVDALNHQSVTLLADPTQPASDSAGRKLAYLELADKADYSTKAVGSGMAKYFESTPAVQNAIQIKAAQSVAQEDKAGLWGEPCNGKFATSGAATTASSTDSSDAEGSESDSTSDSTSGSTSGRSTSKPRSTHSTTTSHTSTTSDAPDTSGQ